MLSSKELNSTQGDSNPAKQEKVHSCLYALAAKCSSTFQQQKEQDIRDHLVIGIRDTQLSKKIQLDAELTLDKAKKHVLQTEAVQETHKKLATPSVDNTHNNPLEVDTVTWRKQEKRGGE